MRDACVRFLRCVSRARLMRHNMVIEFGCDSMGTTHTFSAMYLHFCDSRPVTLSCSAHCWTRHCPHRRRGHPSLRTDAAFVYVAAAGGGDYVAAGAAAASAVDCALAGTYDLDATGSCRHYRCPSSAPQPRRRAVAADIPHSLGRPRDHLHRHRPSAAAPSASDRVHCSRTAAPVSRAAPDRTAPAADPWACRKTSRPTASDRRPRRRSQTDDCRAGDASDVGAWPRPGSPSMDCTVGRRRLRPGRMRRAAAASMRVHWRRHQRA